MSEEEKEAIEILDFFEPDDLVECAMYRNALNVVKNLIEKQEKTILLQDRILRLMVKDMQEKGMWQDMKYESVIEDYKRRRNL